MFGFDTGTYNLVCCKRDKDNNFIHKREVNCFIEMPIDKDNRFVFNMMLKSGVPLVEKGDRAYALGESALEIAYSMPQIEVKRPMKSGCVNPAEKDAFEILKIMMHSLLDDVKIDGDLVYYSVPSNAVNEETDADYHRKIIDAIFKSYTSSEGFKVKAFPINEALALVYAELANKAYTGFGVSCLCPGTKIYTNKGIVDIKDVEEGDSVITHKGRWRTINKIIKKQFKGVATKLQLQGWANSTDFYKFVDNHEIYVKRDEKWKWIGCEELKIGDIIGEPILQTDKSSKKRINSISLYEKITCSKSANKRTITVGPNTQRLIGYFLGDGSIGEAEGAVHFDFKTDEIENIEDVQQILKQNFRLNSSVTKKDSDCIRIKCYSRALLKWFKKHCFDENKNKKYPWNIESLSKSDTISLLAGLVRSDGCFSDLSVEFGNTNTSLILLAKQLFSKLGYATSLSFRDPRTHTTNNGKIIEGKKAEWMISTGAKTSLISLKNIIATINCKNSTFAEKIFIEDGFCCGRIQKIEHEEYQGEVYDLQVEEDHSFSGPFLTIHNCGAGMVNVCYAKFGKDMFTFSIVNSGDWIDKQAAKATGESIAVINKEKTKVKLNESPKNMIERAIQTQYRIMIEKTVTGIKQGLTKEGAKAKSDKPLDFVIAGGTSMPVGFPEIFKEVLLEAKLPIEIGNVFRPPDPLYSVARGCLIAAENAVQN